MALIQKPLGLLVPSRQFAPDVLWAVGAQGAQQWNASYPLQTQGGRLVQGAVGVEAHSSGTDPIWGSTKPLLTSDGAGSGDFTLLALANPVADSTVRAMVGVRQNAPPIHAGVIYANTNAAGAAASGSLCLWTYATAPTTVAAADVVNGRYHVFAARRAGTVHTLWVDGVLVGTTTGTVRAISTTDATSRFAVGAAANTAGAYTTLAAAGTGFQISGGWNSALSDRELSALGKDPWLLFEKRRKLWAVPEAEPLSAERAPPETYRYLHMLIR